MESGSARSHFRAGRHLPLVIRSAPSVRERWDTPRRVRDTDEAPMITGIHHFALTVSDVGRAVAFYRNFGLEVIADREVKGDYVERITGLPGVQVRICHLSGHGHNLELLEYKAPPGARRARDLQDAPAVVAYASDRYVAWQDWLRENERDLLTREPDITSPRGCVTYSNLLDSQRWHAAFHYRQLLAFLDGRGYDLTAARSLASLDGLTLPAEIF